VAEHACDVLVVLAIQRGEVGQTAAGERGLVVVAAVAVGAHGTILAWRWANP
jgi:hypothetical protein